MSDLQGSDLAAWVQAFGSIAAIIGAAAIAIWEARRQHKATMQAAKDARIQFLTSKLDELYVRILASSDELSMLYELAEPLRDGPLPSTRRADFATQLQRPRIDRFLKMYAELYFPRLEPTISAVAEANRNFSKQARAVASGETVNYRDFHDAWRKFETVLGDARRDMLQNRAMHVGATLPRST